MSGINGEADALHDHHISLKGALNCRDMGGHRTIDGRRVRRGVLFRSAELARLTDDDHRIFDEIGIVAIYDLRSNHEREKRPGKLPAHREIRLLARDYDHSDADLERAKEMAEMDQAGLRQMMIELYGRLPYEQAESYAEMFRLIADGHVPLLFHCAAGKDRTGVGAAILLWLLGVERDAIYADFEATNRHFVANRARFLTYGSREGISDDNWDPMLIADRAYLDAMFETLEARHPSPDHYMNEVLAIDAESVAAIRALLIED